MRSLTDDDNSGSEFRIVLLLSRCPLLAPRCDVRSAVSFDLGFRGAQSRSINSELQRDVA